MKAPRILAVAPAVDLDFRYGCTPAWWQLWKGMYEGGLERLLELGARRAEAVFWGADPEFFLPQALEKEMDVFFQEARVERLRVRAGNVGEEPERATGDERARERIALLAVLLSGRGAY